MKFLIIISAVAIFIVNYKFIDIIYKIADNSAENLKLSNINVSENKIEAALIFGDESLSHEISDLLFQYNVSSEILYDISNLNQSKQYDYLVAVNSSDLENLTICSIGLKMMDIKFVLALCNKQYNKKIYEDNQIPYLFRTNYTATNFVYRLLNISNNKEK